MQNFRFIFFRNLSIAVAIVGLIIVGGQEVMARISNPPAAGISSITPFTSDIDAAGYSITNGGTITANRFVATSTSATATSTIANALEVYGTFEAKNLVATSTSQLGTVISGTWNGTAIGSTYGGLGGNFGASTGIVSMSSGVTTVGNAPAFTLGGAVTGNSQSITGLSQLTVTGTSATSTFAGGLTVATSAGNFSVGTSTPAWLMQIAGVRPSFTISDTNAAANRKHWLFSSEGGNLYIGTSTDGYASSTVPAFSITNEGLVGVGVTTTPATQLDVNKTARTGSQQLADGSGTIAIDWLQGNNAITTLTSTGRTVTFSNVQTFTKMTFFIIEDGTGSRTITTWPSTIRWAAGTAPTLTTAANKADVCTFFTATSTTSVFGACSQNY